MGYCLNHVWHDQKLTVLFHFVLQDFEQEDTGKPLIARLPEQLQRQVQAKLKRLKLAAAAAELSDEEDPLAVRSLPRVRSHLTAEARTRQLQDRLGDQGWDRYSLTPNRTGAAGAHAVLVFWSKLQKSLALVRCLLAGQSTAGGLTDPKGDFCQQPGCNGWGIQLLLWQESVLTTRVVTQIHVAGMNAQA